MKTYSYWLALLAMLFLACDSGEEPTGDEKETVSVDADYSVLLTTDDILSSALLNADAETIGINPGTIPFSNSAAPELNYKEDKLWGFLISESDCSAVIRKYDFETFESESHTVFTDPLNCNLKAKALAFGGSDFYIAYELPGAGVGEKDYFIRALDTSGSDNTFLDIEAEDVPVQMVVSGNRVFVLSMEEDEDFTLAVIDRNTNAFVHEINLDSSVLKLFKNPDGDIMVSYPNQHLIVNSQSMAITSTVRYNDGTEPKFGYNEGSFFDIPGNLYYRMPTNLEGTAYPSIPGVYDFENNTAVLYFYENFLTEEERLFEFEIEDTRSIGYDHKNNLILIGYQKSSDPTKGGILRIKPVPDPAFIDNIDLPGVPVEIFID